MLRVRIEVLPHDQENKARTVGVIIVRDNGTCKASGKVDYHYTWTDDCDMGDGGYVYNHDVNDEFWSLLYKIFKQEFSSD
jgi:hypothetical protein